MSSYLYYSPGLYPSVVSATTRAARQTAIATGLGAGALSAEVLDGTGATRWTGTVPAGSISGTGTFLPVTTLTNVSVVAAGTPDSTWVLRLIGAGTNWIAAPFGSGNVWSFAKAGDASAAIDNTSTTWRISLALTTDAPAPAVNDWLVNNVVNSTVSPVPAAADESIVLFAGRMKLDVRYFWVSTAYYPWYSSTLPPENGLYGGVQWHGGWRWNSTALGYRIAELAFPDAYWVEGSATMAQFLIINYGKTSGWTDSDYRWVEFDQWVAAHRAAGKKTIFHWWVNVSGQTIDSFPTDFGPTYIPSVSVARWKDLLDRITNPSSPHYAGDVIGIWEGPNEADLSTVGDAGNWQRVTDGVSTTQLAQYYRLASQFIKANLPNALIAGPVLRNTDPYLTNLADRWFNASAAGVDGGFGSGAGTTAADWCDVWSQHGYNQNQGSPTVIANSLLTLKSKRASIPKMASKPLFCSETMGCYPGTSTYADGDTDKWMWFTNSMCWAAIGAQGLVHFTYNYNDKWGDPTLPGVAARRAWRNSFVQWVTAQEIARIVVTNTDKLRVTRIDGQVRETDGF